MEKSNIIKSLPVTFKTKTLVIHKYDNGYFDITDIKTYDKKFDFREKIQRSKKQISIRDDLRKKYGKKIIFVIGSRKTAKTFIHWSYVRTFFDICGFNYSDIGDFLRIDDVSLTETIPPTYEDIVNPAGYVYCLSHPLFDGVYKIGCTKLDPKVRAAQLSGTSHYIDFKVEFAIEVNDHEKMEKSIHTLLSKFRVNPKREFFKIDIGKIKAMFDLVGGEYYV